MKPRRALCTAVLLAAIVVPSLSGCAAGGPGAAAAQAGVLGELVEQLKKEDDEAEVEEHAAMREIAQEAHERAQEEEIEWR